MIRTIRRVSWLFAILFFLAMESIAPGAQCAARPKGVVHLNPASRAEGTVYLYDDFEGGPGNWILDSTWGLTTSTFRSSSHSLADSPDGNYLPNSDCSATLANPIDLSGAVDPVLVFWHKGNMGCCTDYLFVEVSTDGGTSWTELHHYGDYYLPFRQSTWSLEQFDLSDWKSDSVKVRYRLASDGDDDVDEGWYVDDVRIEEKDAERLSYPFADDFEGGLGNWIVSGRDWDSTTTTSRSSGHSLTDSPEGNYVPFSSCSATLVHPIDLSEAVDPVLVFWHKGSMGCCTDYLFVEVSTDGGTIWSEVHHYGDYYLPIHQSTWSMEELDLRDWSGASVMVRFRLVSNWDDDVGDGWYIDDVSIEEKDTQRLPYPFADDFEGGLGNWIVSGRDWDSTTSTSRSATHSLTDSPEGNYIPFSSCSATLVHPLDLSEAVDPVLVFWHKGNMGCCTDYLFVEVSTDGGISWTEVHHYGDYYLPVHQSTWSLEQLDLRDWRGASVKVRFRLASDWNGDVDDGWYIDDVRIEERDSARLSYPFADDFEGGLGNWIVSGRDWDSTSSTSRSSVHSLTDSPEGNYAPFSSCSATLNHPIDLSEAVDPVLAFWHKGNTDCCTDYLFLEVSTDGGTSWTELHHYGGYYLPFHQSTWSLEQFDLRDWRGASVKVRFRVMSDWDGNVGDGWYIDDVRIEEKDAERLSYPFADDLESGLGNWIVSGRDWDSTSSTSRSATHSLTDSPEGNYLPNSNCSATLVHPIDLSEAVDPVLVFWLKGDIGTGSDDGHVAVSTDDGTTWTDLRNFGASSPERLWHQSTWSLEQVDLRDYKSGSVKVRFCLTSRGGGEVDDGWFIDDVRIEERDVLRLSYPFADDFEGGLGNWIVSGHDWDLTTSVLPSIGYSLTDSPEGNYIHYSNCSVTLMHQVDLSGATGPIVQFAHRGDLGAGDYACVDVSTDSGTNWTQLRTWQGSWDESDSLPPDSVDLDGYKGSNVKVRFRLMSNGDESVGDGWIIDYVRIREHSYLTAVDNEGNNWSPTVLELDQNHPNPFNPSTTIRYCLPERSGVRLEVYDVSGKRIVCLVDSQQEKGAYTIEWNGKDGQGSAVGSGVYFYRLTVGKQTISKKMVLLR